MHFFNYGRHVILLRAVTLSLIPLMLSCSTSDVEPVEYCDVEPIFEENCVPCHGDPTKNGAPVPLTSYDEVYVERGLIRSFVKSGQMPEPIPEDQEGADNEFTVDEKELILQWVEDGAKDCQ